MLKEKVKAPARWLKNYILDVRATYYLKKNAQKKHNKNKLMKIGFIVFEPETWDKLAPVYDELKARGNATLNLIIVPSYDKELTVTTHYGKELNYFRSIDHNAILAFENGGWIDLAKDNYDYIFYQDPYNEHMPPKLKSSNVVRYSRICYIPYGVTGSDVFTDLATNKSFFRNVAIGFMDVSRTIEVLRKRYSKNIDNGCQEFDDFGYPAYEEAFRSVKSHPLKNIIWTPRWSYDSKVGGSHFFEYKDKFLELNDAFPGVDLSFRAHPMMFSNFIREKRMTSDEYHEYLKLLVNKNVRISKEDFREDFERADLLITDYSSIIPAFFFTGKPIILCPPQFELNKEYKYIASGIYQCDSWNEVLACIKNLRAGIDPLFETRKKIINEQKIKHMGASNRICNRLLRCYESQGE